jgi:hypothetical protein
MHVTIRSETKWRFFKNENFKKSSRLYKTAVLIRTNTNKKPKRTAQMGLRWLWKRWSTSASRCYGYRTFNFRLVSVKRYKRT